MRVIFRPASLLFFLLFVINSFLLGMFYAGATDAGLNQGLAGGAIVLSYGINFGLVALILSFFVILKVSLKKIILLNKILTLILAMLVGILAIRIVNTNNGKNSTSIPQFEILQASGFPLNLNVQHYLTDQQQDGEMGLGMFAPTQTEDKPFYFYGKPNFEKSIIEHPPSDSLTFKRLEVGQYDIVSAPPWLQPQHLKLDYGVFYFKVVAISEDFVEVVVNITNQQTAYVDKRAGQMLYWPDFLTQIQSVEFISSQNVFVKPLDNAGTVSTSFSFMRPVKIRRDWMEVILINDDFDPVGKGWIRWHDKGKLLISYNLFS